MNKVMWRSLSGEELFWKQLGGKLSSRMSKSQSARQKSAPLTWRELLVPGPILQLRILVMVILVAVLLIMMMATWKFTAATNSEEVEEHSLRIRSEVLMRASAQLEALCNISAAVGYEMAMSLGSDPSARNVDDFEPFVHSVSRILFPALKTVPASMGLLYTDMETTWYAGYFKVVESQDPANFFKSPSDPIPMGRIINMSTGTPISGLFSMVIDAPQEVKMMGMRMRQDPSLSILQDVGNLGHGLPPVLVSKVRVVFSKRIPAAPAKPDASLDLIFSARDVSNFMSLLDLGGGFMYISTSTGILVATTLPGNATRVDHQTGAASLVRVVDADIPLIAAVGRHLEAKYGGPAGFMRADIHETNVRICGDKYFIDGATVNANGLQMMVVTVIRRNLIMGRTDTTNQRTVLFLNGIALTCLTIFMGLVMGVTHFMAKELSLREDLSKETEARAKAEACKASAKLFLANLGHDISTPSLALKQLLLIFKADDKLPPALDSVVEQALSTTNILHVLIRAITAISKVEAGTLKLQPVAFDPRTELEAISRLFSVEGMNKGVRIVLSLQPGIPSVMGDVHHFREIFISLLGNCTKYASSGYIELRATYSYDGGTKGRTSKCRETDGCSAASSATPPQVRTPRGEASVGRSISGKALVGRSISGKEASGKAMIRLQFEIEDSGETIPVEHREAIFENFVALPDTSTRYGGTGIGLGIVRLLLELMGGGIRIADKDSPGTCFLFHLCLPAVGP